MIGRVIVALDVGNTNITVGIVGGGDVVSSRRARDAAVSDRR